MGVPTAASSALASRARRKDREADPASRRSAITSEDSVRVGATGRVAGSSRARRVLWNDTHRSRGTMPGAAPVSSFRASAVPMSRASSDVASERSPMSRASAAWMSFRASAASRGIGLSSLERVRDEGECGFLDSALRAPLGMTSQSRTRRSSCALMATMIVLSDISTAPTAGLSTTPCRCSTPAASGMATMLYPAAHHRFWIIFR